MKWLCKNLSWALFSSSAVFSLPQYCSQSPSYEDFPKRTQSSPIPHSPQHSIPTLLITAQWTAQPWALLTFQVHLDFASAFSLVSRHFFFFSVTASPNYPMCHHCQSYHHKGNLYSCHCLLKDLQFSPPPTELRAKLSVWHSLSTNSFLAIPLAHSRSIL